MEGFALCAFKLHSTALMLQIRTGLPSGMWYSCVCYLANICRQTSGVTGMTSADLFQVLLTFTSVLDYVLSFVLVHPFPSLSFSCSLYSWLSPFLLYFISSLLSSPLFSSSPDVGAGPGGSCCSLQFVSVKHQLVSEGVCARPLGRSCSSTAALDFYSFS